MDDYESVVFVSAVTSLRVSQILNPERREIQTVSFPPQPMCVVKGNTDAPRSITNYKYEYQNLSAVSVFRHSNKIDTAIYSP